MKKARKIFAIILSTAMLVGTVLSANAEPRLVARLCPVGTCRQSNQASGVDGHCSCGQPMYKYVCSSCGAIYYVCKDGHKR